MNKKRRQRNDAVPDARTGYWTTGGYERSYREARPRGTKYKLSFVFVARQCATCGMRQACRVL